MNSGTYYFPKNKLFEFIIKIAKFFKIDWSENKYLTHDMKWETGYIRGITIKIDSKKTNMNTEMEAKIEQL